MRCFILAGGFATRLWPLTEKRAKPLLPIAGQPIVSHLLKKIPEDIPVTVSTNEAFAEGFQRWQESVDRPHVSLLIERSHSDSQKLGALAALADWIGQESIDDDILVLTGDNYLGFSLRFFLSSYRPGTPLLAAVDIGDRQRASLFGTVLLDPQDSKRIVGFEEKPKEPKSTVVSTGCSVLPKSLLPVVMEFAAAHPDNIGSLFEEFLRRGIPVDAALFTEPWLDIGSFSSYLEAHKLVVGKRTLLEPDATVDGVACEGSVAVGTGSRVRGGELRDSIVFDHCVIEDCILRNCIVDDHCELRGVDLNDKMLRSGTILTQR